MQAQHELAAEQGSLALRPHHLEAAHKAETASEGRGFADLRFRRPHATNLTVIEVVQMFLNLCPVELEIP